MIILIRAQLSVPDASSSFYGITCPLPATCAPVQTESGGSPAAPAAPNQFASHQIIDRRTRRDPCSLDHADDSRSVIGSVVGLQRERSRVALAVRTDRHLFHNNGRARWLPNPFRGIGCVVARPGN